MLNCILQDIQYKYKSLFFEFLRSYTLKYIYNIQKSINSLVTTSLSIKVPFEVSKVAISILRSYLIYN